MKLLRKAFPVIAIAFLSPVLSASLRLPNIFADNMVLQRESSVTFWGWSDPRATVQIETSWNQSKANVITSDEDGKWSIAVETPSEAGPYEVVIRSQSDSVHISNVLMGEVWIASGQSNMEMPLRGFNNQPVEGSIETILSSSDSSLRFFKVKRNTSGEPLDDLEGEWIISNPSEVSEISAAGYYFGHYIHNTLNVPVAVITSSWGGTPVQSWMPPEAVGHLPKEEIERSTEAKDQYRPGFLYNAMIHPLVPYGIRGGIWYQGESNWRSPETYTEYFSDMVTQWRTAWDRGNFPFYYTQISPYQYDNPSDPGSTYLREAQLRALKVIDNVGMAVTLDIGKERNIHPPQKRTVGLRLALLALEQTYGVKGLHSQGAVLKDYEVIEGKMRLYFDNIGLGFVPREGELQNFEIAGEDRVFHPAKAIITREPYLDIYAEEVPEPVAVRYAWKNWVVGDLISASGIPASSFRTDDWQD